MVRWLAVLGVVTAAFTVLPQAQAVEQGLAGIRLGQPALDLLDLKPYGPPQFLGPVGAVTTWGIKPPETATPVGGAPAGITPGYGPAPTPAAGGGARISLGSRPGPLGGLQFGFGAGRRATPSPAAPAAPLARPPALQFGFGASRTSQTPTLGAAQPRAVPSAALAGEGGGPIYWLYSFGSTQVAVGIDADGKVSSIVLSGPSYPAAKTEGGVRLGDSYTSVLDKYGFPDSTQNIGVGLVLQYASPGLTLTLQNMRVRVIALARPAPVGEAVPGRPGAPTAPPGGYGVRALGAATQPPIGPATTAGTRTRVPPRLRIHLGGRSRY
jgi:hypothetical protein